MFQRKLAPVFPPVFSTTILLLTYHKIITTATFALL